MCVLCIYCNTNCVHPFRQARYKRKICCYREKCENVIKISYLSHSVSVSSSFISYFFALSIECISIFLVCANGISWTCYCLTETRASTKKSIQPHTERERGRERARERHSLKFWVATVYTVYNFQSHTSALLTLSIYFVFSFLSIRLSEMNSKMPSIQREIYTHSILIIVALNCSTFFCVIRNN